MRACCVMALARARAPDRSLSSPSTFIFDRRSSRRSRSKTNTHRRVVVDVVSRHTRRDGQPTRTNHGVRSIVDDPTNLTRFSFVVLFFVHFATRSIIFFSVSTHQRCRAKKKVEGDFEYRQLVTPSVLMNPIIFILRTCHMCVCVFTQR